MRAGALPALIQESAVTKGAAVMPSCGAAVGEPRAAGRLRVLFFVFSSVFLEIGAHLLSQLRFRQHADHRFADYLCAASHRIVRGVRQCRCREVARVRLKDFSGGDVKLRLYRRTVIRDVADVGRAHEAFARRHLEAFGLHQLRRHFFRCFIGRHVFERQFEAPPRDLRAGGERGASGAVEDFLDYRFKIIV
ncbi:hypothetical protein SDC9_112832 [bioreactor metagenome]|uniref:Uncharacterized protein n=1 Tax=bioreactor metagenome TaxID=1076179 RepID=A0A645BLD6_9ZZZZ